MPEGEHEGEHEAEWLELGESPFRQLGLGNINKLALCVADSPFEKVPLAHYYPEVCVISSEGKLLTRISPLSN